MSVIDTRLQVGSVEVLALRDAAGPFFQPLTEALPGATDASLVAARKLDPGAFDDAGEWWLHFWCFLVRDERGSTLVDAGVGPAGSLAEAWAPVPGRLPKALAEVGVDRAEIDTVVLTHLHSDHIGWSVVDRAAWFPNARYVVQQAELASVAGTPTEDLVVNPLRETSQLSALAGDTALRPGIRVIATPGHTPGHQSVLVEDGDDRLLVAGDLLVHPVQLVDPTIGYAYEADPKLAAATRVRLLTDVKPGHEFLLSAAHLSQPFLLMPVS